MKTGGSERDQATATHLLDRLHRAVAVKVVVGDVWSVSPDISQAMDRGPNRMPALCAPTALMTASMTSSTNRTRFCTAIPIRTVVGVRLQKTDRGDSHSRRGSPRRRTQPEGRRFLPRSRRAARCTYSSISSTVNAHGSVSSSFLVLGGSGLGRVRRADGLLSVGHGGVRYVRAPTAEVDKRSVFVHRVHDLQQRWGTNVTMYSPSGYTTIAPTTRFACPRFWRF